MILAEPEAGASVRLRIEGMSKAFAGVPVLRDVGLVAGKGEVVALLGANGAGKSTLMKILAGVQGGDEGRILIDGAEVSIRSPRDAIAAGIRLLPQEISVHPDLTVAENIAMAELPRWRLAGIPLVSQRSMDQQARALLDRLGLSGVSPRRRMGSLGLQQQRIVEIARALAGRARILIMDEPTAALAQAEADALVGVMRQLRTEGVTILYISHDLDEVFRLSDHMVVLRDGRVAGAYRTAETYKSEVLTAMLGKKEGELYPAKPAATARDTLLTVEGLSLPGRLHDLSFSVGQGEILGIFGLLGSGAETVGRAVYGTESRASLGAARLGTEPFRPRSPRHSIKAGMALVAAERKREGILAGMTVRENTTLAFLSRFTRRGFVDARRETLTTLDWIGTLGVRTAGPEQEIRFLSGGNQQKICLARWLVGDLKVLVLEEPTRGVDLGARREIYEEIRRLASGGLGVLLVSGDAEETAGLCDRTLVMRHGRIVAEFDQDATARQLLQAADGDHRLDPRFPNSGFRNPGLPNSGVIAAAAPKRRPHLQTGNPI